MTEKIEVDGKLIRKSNGEISFRPSDDSDVKEYIAVRTEICAGKKILLMQKKEELDDDFESDDDSNDGDGENE